MLSAAQRKWASRAVSALLLAVTLLAAVRLLTGTGSGVVKAVVVSKPPEVLDSTVYRFDGKTYTRIGHIVDKQGLRHRLQIVPDAQTDIAGYAAVQLPVSLPQYLRMLPKGDLDQLLKQIVDAASSVTGSIVTYLHEDPDGQVLRAAFSDVWDETLQSPELLQSRTVIAMQMRDEISPIVIRRLRHILISRIEHAINVIYVDATENYGLDLVGGEFDLKPLTDAVDGFLADPRVLDTVAEALTELAEDPQVSDAAQTIAISYVDALQKRLMTVDVPLSHDESVELRTALNSFFSNIQGFIYRDGEANPVVMSLARNLISGDGPWANAIIVLMKPELAASEFSHDRVLPLSIGWGGQS